MEDKIPNINNIIPEDLMELLPVNFRLGVSIDSGDADAFRAKFYESDFYQTIHATAIRPTKPISKIFSW
ncbi:hypothetical protein [Mucilaginibacter sp. UYCu711]|uniref:hypothetical protein n=1 Tax=Mucilaginibacter sp. UYCu711 TaxID=3156339 RepID=UPI003D22A7A8